MTAPRQSFAGRYASMVLVNLLAVTAISALGYLPMQRWWGPDSRATMLAGSVIVLLAACLAAIPVCRVAKPGGALVNQMLAATAIRMFATLALALAAALSGRWLQKPLLVWVALAYLATLLVDTVWLTRLLKADHRDAPGELK